MVVLWPNNALQVTFGGSEGRGGIPLPPRHCLPEVGVWHFVLFRNSSGLTYCWPALHQRGVFWWWDLVSGGSIPQKLGELLATTWRPVYASCVGKVLQGYMPDSLVPAARLWTTGRLYGHTASLSEQREMLFPQVWKHVLLYLYKYAPLSKQREVLFPQVWKHVLRYLYKYPPLSKQREVLFPQVWKHVLRYLYKYASSSEQCEG